MQTVEQVRQALRWARPVRSLAALVRVAIQDGREMLAEREDIRPDWSTWYRARSLEGSCTACFGGAVMLGTLASHRLDSLDVVTSHHLAIICEREQYEALAALDRVRRGDLRSAYSALRLWHDRPDDPECNRNAFRAAVRALKLARFERTGGVTSAPAHFEFVRRDQFDEFLDDVEELADQLAEIEAEHLKGAA